MVFKKASRSRVETSLLDHLALYTGTTMLTSFLILIAALAPAALGCPQHTNNKRPRLVGRQSNPAQNPNSNTTNNIWAYEVSTSCLIDRITLINGVGIL